MFEPCFLFRVIALRDEADLDRAHHSRRAFAGPESHLAMRQLADLLQEIANRLSLPGKRDLHPGRRVEPRVLARVADRAHHVDERAEPLLESEIALAGFRP